MGIDGIPPSIDPASRFDKPENSRPTPAPEVKYSGPAKPVQGKSENEVLKVSAHVDKAVEAKDEKAAEAGDNTKIARSVAELQTLADKMRSATEQNMLRGQVQAVNQSIVQTRQDLAELSGETAQMTLDVAGSGISKVSYWQQLEIAEKTRKINELKDRLRSMELERSDYVQMLREQVEGGSYSVSGSEILKGMLDEWM